MGRAASAAFFFALGAASGPVRADAPAAIVGVNVVNPQWDARAEQDATLDAVQRAGVSLIRIPLVPPNGGTLDGTIDYIDRAARRGLRVLLVIYPSYRPDAPSRPLVPGEPEMFSLPPLSAADAGLFAKTYEPVLRRIDRIGMTLAGIELGNEINWAAFNGEFPVPGSGRVLGDRALRDDPLGRRIATGLRAYVRSAAALKAIRDRLVANRRTPIISAGLADIRPGEPADAIEIPATLRFLRAAGLDAYIDGYGVHTYPPADRPQAERAAYLDAHVFAECGSPPAGKPCWLTEWGYPSPSLACPAVDGSRQRLVGETRDYLAGLARAGRLAAAIYYQWDGEEDRLGLYRCGGMTASGALALRPLAPDQ